MRNIRLIARLDIKAPYLVKGIQYEGLRKIGNPNDFALNYYRDNIDELYYEDIVASLYERNSLIDIIKSSTRDIFIPITVGGGLRSIDDVANVLRAGADKVAINTAAIKDPRIISDLSDRFGSSTIVLSIQAKKNNDSWEAYYDNGREHSYKNVIDWIIEAEKLGAGEVCLASVDMEGTGKGFDYDLIKAVTDKISIPVIASGGMGNLEHLEKVILNSGADAVAMANVLHYNHCTVSEIRNFCISKNFPIRR